VKYQNPGNYHSKVIAKVKVFGGRQKDRQDKNRYHPPTPLRIFDLGSIKRFKHV
jgi:hypothetical protein